MRKVPVVSNGQIVRFTSSRRSEKSSFWNRHHETIRDWIDICALIFVVEMLIVHLA
jgi:hypothetical protein